MIKENHEADKKGLNKYIDGIYEEEKRGGPDTLGEAKLAGPSMPTGN